MDKTTAAHEAPGDDDVDAEALLRFSTKRRVTMIRQTESSECGLACLAMISDYFGQRVNMLELRLKYRVSSKGIDLARLIEIAHDLDLSTRPVRLELDQVSLLEMPCIIHWGFNHFVVLTSVKKRGAWVNDPAYGSRFIPWSDLSKKFTGVALELSSSATFKKKSAPNGIALRKLAGPMSGLSSSLLKIFAMAAALELISLLSPQYAQIAIDQVLADRDKGLLMTLGAVFLALLLVQCAISAMRTWTVVQLGATFSIGWSTNVFRHLVQLPQAYFLKRNLGDILSRFSAINTIQQTVTTKFVEAILDGIMASVTFITLALYSGSIALISLAAVLGYLGLRLLYYHVYREGNLNQILTLAKQQTTLMEAMRGIQTIQLHNKQSSRAAQFMNQTADVVNRNIYVQRLQLIFDAFNSSLSGVQRIATIWLSAWLGLNGSFTGGMLIAVLAYSDQFSTRAVSLVDFIIAARLLRLQGERLGDIVLTPIEDNSKESGLQPEDGDLSVAFDGVSFRYGESDPWILRDTSFVVNAGEAVAIVGPSGCGKSTIARLASGLLEPERGYIRVGGLDIRHLGKRVLRELMSVVMQDDCLFNGSIAENVCFFDAEAKLERIQAACRDASIHADIASMPMGYHTLVGDMGSSLSGGQRQRLLLARAFYRSSQVLLLDEATSHLDPVTENAVNEAIRNKKLTRLVIAHRSETIRSCDRVIEVVRDGILFYDTPEQYFVAKNSHFIASAVFEPCA